MAMPFLFAKEEYMATTQQVNNFIQTIAPIIQRVAKERGYKVCSPVIAQACIESAYGTSSLGYKYFNYFGMKCGSSWKGKSVNLSTKEEYTVGTLTTIKDNFRVYDSMEAGVNGYFDFISTSRYANLKTATTAQQYLEMIKADGYATSSTYVQTNMSVVNKYNLTDWDNGQPTIIITKSIGVVAKEVIDGKWGTGTSRKTKLVNAGYNYDKVQSRVNEIIKTQNEISQLETKLAELCK